MGDLTLNFSVAEFRCPDGSPIPPEYMSNLRTLATNLQVLRDEIGESIHVNSGYRSPDYNRRIGGARNSQHLYARAADIRARTRSPQQLQVVIEQLIAQGRMMQGGLGLYNSFVHYDVRGTRARWSHSGG
jgi:uncharacterized protein YcbK (DUF882 family)